MQYHFVTGCDPFILRVENKFLNHIIPGQYLFLTCVLYEYKTGRKAPHSERRVSIIEPDIQVENLTKELE